MATSVLFIAVCFLAYANGANDNFKGVATLFGSGTAKLPAGFRLGNADDTGRFDLRIISGDSLPFSDFNHACFVGSDAG